MSKMYTLNNYLETAASETVARTVATIADKAKIFMLYFRLYMYIYIKRVKGKRSEEGK